MTRWKYFDPEGNQVRPEAAAFKLKTILTDKAIGVPGPRQSNTEYRDVHVIGTSDRRHFKEWPKVLAWFKEHAEKAKGKGR